MCTLTLAWRLFDETPIAVAANRDESLERPSEPPGVYNTNPLVIAPRDTRAGGTWIGYNEHGVFAGITNRWTDTELAGERSRGQLVADVLECSSVRIATRYLERTTDEYEYDGFNLVIADETVATYLEWDGTLRRHDLEPGVHVVVNTGFDETFDIPESRSEAAREQAENARVLRRVLEIENADDDTEVAAATAQAWLERASRLLGDHDYGVCVHGDGFGTRSSSLITLGVHSSYEFAPGPPCRTAYAAVDIERQI